MLVGVNGVIRFVSFLITFLAEILITLFCIKQQLIDI